MVAFLSHFTDGAIHQAFNQYALMSELLTFFNFFHAIFFT